ncbi:cytochrome P450 [Mycobacterium intermedium]|uniref:Cytochrome P450 n=1 Tax=Mycobacterium intermedium TaxID=28445 RepID=A0A1E3SL03_MYCIE|nr:cytochrome P450 [Mycobacterium intermedium]MCV6963442.1 cytochrome P450 [Mycobacterium intermedium]ODR02830.1 cytochrome [Mycobacterium intermedium]OPE46894.1 cytochrome P450 [Mycobacterium intermedium]ORA98685.1 cytochrome P450 [Mycobacterium intermedium]
MTVTETVRFTGTAVKAFGGSIRANSRGIRARREARNGAAITSYDPLDPATAAQPHEAYRQLHAGGRVQYNPKRAVWILSRLDDVRRALRDDTALSSADGPARVRVRAPTLVSTDGEKHAKLRRQAMPAFTKAALENWRLTIDELAAETVRDVLENPGCDVVQRLAVPVPVRLIAQLLGIPDTDVADFRKWSEATTQITGVALTAEGARKLAQMLRGSWAMHQYFRRQFALGGLKGSGTILGRLLAENDAGSLSDSELFQFAILLLLAGNETTTNLLGGLFATLAAHPEQFDIVRTDTALIPMAIEEGLRYLSPAQNVHRTAVRDYRVGDVTIPAGERVLLSIGAANRDPRVFDEPDEFRADRKPTQHIAFGFGVHLCIGAQLTRMEAQAVLRELVTQASGISAVGETSWSTNSLLRGPTCLPVCLTPA